MISLHFVVGQNCNGYTGLADPRIMKLLILLSIHSSLKKSRKEISE